MKRKGIKISDGESVLSVRLTDILRLISNGKDFQWVILYSEVVPLQEFATDIMNLENKIEAVNSGILTTWDELLSIANKIYQEIEFGVVGYKSNEFYNQYVKEKVDWKQIHLLADFSIEVIDSSYWEIFSNEKKILNRCMKMFRKIEWIDSSIDIAT